MLIENPFFRMFGLIAASTAAGYLTRRWRILPEKAAKWLMTFVVVVGYSAVAFFSIWGTRIRTTDIWLPVLSSLQKMVMIVIALLVARLITNDHKEIGLFGVTSAVGNHGATMGGFVLFLLYGNEGLGLANIYCLFFTPLMILVLFPVARHYSGQTAGQPLGRLILRSFFDWRSVGLLFAIAGIILSISGVQRPVQVERYHLVAIGVYAINFLVYFSIGLRLRVSYFGRVMKLLAAVSFMRFGVSIAVCLGLLYLTHLTFWPISQLRWNVVLVQSFTPTAVTNVAIANMFDLKPREASILFVLNTFLYLVVVLPVVFWIFG